jgi:hypothetical protein
VPVRVACRTCGQTPQAAGRGGASVEPLACTREVLGRADPQGGNDDLDDDLDRGLGPVADGKVARQDRGGQDAVGGASDDVRDREDRSGDLADDADDVRGVVLDAAQRVDDRMTGTPTATRRSVTGAQLPASAKAPCTSRASLIDMSVLASESGCSDLDLDQIAP